MISTNNVSTSRLTSGHGNIFFKYKFEKINKDENRIFLLKKCGNGNYVYTNVTMGIWELMYVTFLL